MNTARCIAALIIVIICNVGWLLRSENVPNLDLRLASPSDSHWAGTDHLGRDVLVRTLRATATATAVVLPAWTIATTFGIFIGIMGAKFERRLLGTLVGFAIRLVFTTPFLLALVGLGAIFGRGIGVTFFIIILWAWAAPARLARTMARDALGAVYTRAAVAVGYSPTQLARYVLTPVCVRSVFAASGGMLIEILALDMALTLFGFGPPPPDPTLGNLVIDGLRFFSIAPWITVAPLVVMCAVSVLFRAALQDTQRATFT